MEKYDSIQCQEFIDLLKYKDITFKIKSNKIQYEQDGQNIIWNLVKRQIDLDEPNNFISFIKSINEDDEERISFAKKILNSKFPIRYSGNNSDTIINVCTNSEFNEFTQYPYPFGQQGKGESLGKIYRANPILMEYYEENKTPKYSGINEFAAEVDQITFNKNYNSYVEHKELKAFSFDPQVPSLHYIDYDRVIEASKRTPELFLNALKIFVNSEDYCTWWGCFIAGLAGQVCYVRGAGEEGKTTLSKTIASIIFGNTKNYLKFVGDITDDMTLRGFTEGAFGKLLLIGDDMKQPKILKSSLVHKIASNRGTYASYTRKGKPSFEGLVTASVIMHENDMPYIDLTNPNEDRRVVFIECESNERAYIGNTIEENESIGNDPSAYGRILTSSEFNEKIFAERYEIIAHILNVAGLLKFVKTRNLSDIEGFRYNIVKNRQVVSNDNKQYFKEITKSDTLTECERFIEKHIIFTGNKEDFIPAYDLKIRLKDNSHWNENGSLSYKRIIENILRKMLKDNKITDVKTHQRCLMFKLKPKIDVDKPEQVFNTVTKRYDFL